MSKLIRLWDPAAGEVKVQSFAKLLGVYVGPGAADKTWREPELK